MFKPRDNPAPKPEESPRGGQRSPGRSSLGTVGGRAHDLSVENSDPTVRAQQTSVHGITPEALMERFGINELAQELIIQGYLDIDADARCAASKIILAVEKGSDDDQGIENPG